MSRSSEDSVPDIIFQIDESNILMKMLIFSQVITILVNTQKIHWVFTLYEISLPKGLRA